LLYNFDYFYIKIVIVWYIY